MQWIIAGFLLWLVLVVIALWLKQREILNQFNLFGIRVSGVVVKHAFFRRPLVRFQSLEGVVVEAEGDLLYKRLKTGRFFGIGQQINVVYDQRNPWSFRIDDSVRA